MTPKEAERIRAKKATTIPCPNLVEFEKRRMALEKAVKEDEKRAEKREKLLQEMRNGTKDVKTTRKQQKTRKQKGDSETDGETMSSLQAVREAKQHIAQLDKEAKRPGSAHGSTPDNASEKAKQPKEKKDKKEKKEKKVKHPRRMSQHQVRAMSQNSSLQRQQRVGLTQLCACLTKPDH